MKCKKCGSTWQSNVQLDKCPFCGISFIEKSESTSIVGALKTIIENNGKDILNSSGRLMAMVVDYVNGQEREKRLFQIACQHGILEDIYEILSTPNDENKKEIARKSAIRLEYDAFLSKENAQIIVNLLLTGVGAGVQLDEINAGKEEKNKGNQRKLLGNLQSQPNKLPDTCTQKAKVVFFLAKACCASAQFDMGNYYINGDEGLDANKDEAVKWYRMAAKQGHADAQMILNKLGYNID